MQSADNRISQFFTWQIKFIKFSTKYQKQLGFIHKKKKQWRIVTENFSHVAYDYVTFCHRHDFGQSTQK